MILAMENLIPPLVVLLPPVLGDELIRRAEASRPMAATGDGLLGSIGMAADVLHGCIPRGL